MFRWIRKWWLTRKRRRLQEARRLRKAEERRCEARRQRITAREAAWQAYIHALTKLMISGGM